MCVLVYLHTCVNMLPLRHGVFIKLSNRESQPRKIELTFHIQRHNDYREYFTHNNRACKCPYCNNRVIYSLVNDLYKITTESIKLVLKVEQFGGSNDLIIPTPNIQKVLYFFYVSSLRYSMDSTEMSLNIFQPRIHHEVCCLLYLQHKFWLSMWLCKFLRMIPFSIKDRKNDSYQVAKFFVEVISNLFSQKLSHNFLKFC